MKFTITILSTLISICAFIPYYISIYKGNTRPHVISWVIWGTTTLIAFAAQLAGNGGFGVIAMGVSALMSIGVAIIAFYKRNEIKVTFADNIVLVIAILALPIWLLTNSPIWATLICTFVDSLGVLPTLRKVYRDPYSETTVIYGMIFIRNSLVLINLDVISTTTALFPFAMNVGALVIVYTVWVRKKEVKRCDKEITKNSYGMNVANY